MKKLFELLRKWSSIQRYSKFFLIKPETVAEHTGHVALICLKIGIEIEQNCGYKINWQQLLPSAIVHDLDEIFTGDIPRDTKYSSEKFKKMYDDIAKAGMKEVLKIYELPKEIETAWISQKNETIEGYILRVADLACVVYKVYCEVELYGNISMKDVYDAKLAYFVECLIDDLSKKTHHEKSMKVIIAYKVLLNEAYAIDGIMKGCKEVIDNAIGQET